MGDTLFYSTMLWSCILAEVLLQHDLLYRAYLEMGLLLKVYLGNIAAVDCN